MNEFHHAVMQQPVIVMIWHRVITVVDYHVELQVSTKKNKEKCECTPKITDVKSCVK